MPVQRIQWTCPVCKRRYAIPASAPTPSRCPQCQQEEILQGSASVIAVEPEQQEDTSREVTQLSALAAIRLEVAEEAARGPSVAPAALRHSDAAIKRLAALAQVFTVIAGITVVGAFAGLIYGLQAALVMPPTPARTTAIFVAIGGFCGGLIAALTFFTLGELIRLLLGMDENLRRGS